MFNLNDSISRTLGALGISVNSEVAKKEMRLLASRFAGMSIALSLTVSNKRKRLICHSKLENFDYYSSLHAASVVVMFEYDSGDCTKSKMSSYV